MPRLKSLSCSLFLAGYRVSLYSYVKSERTCSGIGSGYERTQEADCREGEAHTELNRELWGDEQAVSQNTALIIRGSPPQLGKR